MKIDGGEDRICVVEAFYLALMGQINLNPAIKA
jgi:hypothetical protein